jgi:hypothetical protein
MVNQLPARAGLRYNDGHSSPARGPSAGARPGRCGACWLAEPHRPLSQKASGNLHRGWSYLPCFFPLLTGEVLGPVGHEFLQSFHSPFLGVRVSTRAFLLVADSPSKDIGVNGAQDVR